MHSALCAVSYRVKKSTGDYFEANLEKPPICLRDLFCFRRCVPLSFSTNPNRELPCLIFILFWNSSRRHHILQHLHLSNDLLPIHPYLINSWLSFISKYKTCLQNTWHGFIQSYSKNWMVQKNKHNFYFLRQIKNNQLVAVHTPNWLSNFLALILTLVYQYKEE